LDLELDLEFGKHLITAQRKAYIHTWTLGYRRWHYIGTIERRLLERGFRGGNTSTGKVELVVNTTADAESSDSEQQLKLTRHTYERDKI